MYKKIYWLFLFSTFLSFSQKSAKEEVIEKISTSVCECTSKREINKNNVKIGLGTCLLEAMNTHKAEMLKAYNVKKIDKNLIEKVLKLIDQAEYKRRQYPPGTKVSGRAFGKDRRLPMTSHWNER